LNNPPAPREPGLVVTFYSYKGGVGRSMALANVAALLAKWGRRVLVIDWDLEAPGLEKYFDGDRPDRGARTLSAQRKQTPGVVDLVHAFRDGRALDWRQCLLTVEPGPGQKIKLLSAGQDSDEYAARVRALAWDRLFEENDFGEHLEQLRQEWTEVFDFVLIDSRTGLTDIGGICTIHLPDVLVAMFTANEQSMAGVKRVMQQARAAQQALPFDRARLSLVPVPARDESVTEHEKSREWREIFARELGEFYGAWLPRETTPRKLLERLKIPYKAYWSFGERLPVMVEGTNDPASIGYAYRVLAQLINNRLDWKATAEPNARVDDLERKASEAQAQAARQKTLIKRALAVTGAIGVLLAVGISMSSIRERKREEEARELAAAARAASITAQAISSDDPLETVLLMAELPAASPVATQEIVSVTSQEGFTVPFALLPHGRPVTVAAFSPDGKDVATGSEDGSVRVWQADGRAPGVEVFKAAGSIERILWSPDGQRLLFLHRPRPLGGKVVRKDGKQLWDLTPGLDDARFRSDEALVVVQENRVNLVELKKAGEVATSSFSPRGKVLIDHAWMGPDNEHPLVTGPRGAGLLRGLDKPPPWVDLIDSKPRHLLIAGVSTSARVVAQAYLDPALEMALRVWQWSAVDKSFRELSRVPSDRIEGPVVWGMSVSENVLALLSIDGHVSIRVLEQGVVRAGQSIRTSASLNFVTLSEGRDSWRVLATDDNGVARVWDARDGKLIAALRGHAGVLNGAWFSSDGQKVVTCSSDGTARVWPASSSAAAVARLATDGLGVLKGLTTACLFPEQRVRFLAEPEADALARYRRCEQANGRTPLQESELDRLRETRYRARKERSESRTRK